MGEKILIVDADKAFVKGLKYSLEQDNYETEIVTSGKNAVDKINKKSYEMVLLELEMPDMSGLTICQNIRNVSSVPIIFLTENDEDIKKILALEYGADDYLVKPFNILELKARIKAILRRVNKVIEGNKHIIEINDFTINSLGRKITRLDKDINLTGKEFDLLYILASSPGKVFTREELLEKVWGYEYYGDLRTVDVHIRRIREKIEQDPKSSEYILTKWGVGYYFKGK
ncbi:response regulator transcription factor [Paratissierella segnis]|jgi:DNA-binding response OmpR family regulator|uniref:Response regulator transcription factor n=1 Tax=Paratissierella segnis TaxID=2763679 RepID=A0A926EYW3_9FIRM|nr:response regulator transcription factor [Paratissierella segnis]MBC8588819.1 response regulator transcription factor [Paratissierella segnis]